LNVISIDRVQVADLTRADARREGIGSLSELLDAIGVLYPGVRLADPGALPAGVTSRGSYNHCDLTHYPRHTLPSALAAHPEGGPSGERRKVLICWGVQPRANQSGDACGCRRSGAELAASPRRRRAHRHGRRRGWLAGPSAAAANASSCGRLNVEIALVDVGSAPHPSASSEQRQSPSEIRMARS
jgi:hypothetical protein